MSTAFLAIQSALLAALSAAPALAGGRISANRLRPIAANQVTALVVRLDASEGTEYTLGTVNWQSAYTVECYARAAAGADPSGAVDDLLASTWARLSALSFETLGASVSLNPRIDWQYDADETSVVCAVIRLTAQHQTTTASLQH